MEFHWFYKAWRIRAARGRKRKKVAEIVKIFLHFHWNSYFSGKLLGIHEKSPFRTFPNHWYSLSFIGHFSRAPLHFQERPSILRKRGGIPPFYHSGAQKCTSGPQNGLLGPRRKSLYKRKVLGGVLEAEDRKSAFFIRKERNSSKIQEIHRKSWNFQIPRKCSRTHEMLVFLL